MSQVGRRVDVAVIGGGLGGCAAALAAAELDATVVLVSEDEWIGGQLTTQAVPPDEHPWLESTGCTRSYRQLRRSIRDLYRRTYPLTPEARAAEHLDPGRANIGGLAHEPRVALQALWESLLPHCSRGTLEVLTGQRVLGCEVSGDRVSATEVQCARSGVRLWIEAAYFVDATEFGDVLDLAGVESVLGAESSQDTGEPHALDGPADPGDQQAPSWSIALDHRPGESHVIDRPETYGFWRSYQAPFWPGPQLGWRISDIVTHETRHRPLFADDTRDHQVYDLWHTRRIRCRTQFAPGWSDSDITIANWPAMDYWIKPVLGGGAEQRAEALDGARQLALSFLYWLQTEAERPDGGTGFPGLRPRGDVVGTADGLARHVYVREARRIVPVFRVVEQHLGVEARAGLEGAERFVDTVGVGAYRIDVHPSSGLRNSIDLSTWPFQIPLGALLPVRVENLLPAAKNIGTTHLTNGCYRVHPVEWNIGEAAGALAAFCVAERRRPHEVRERRDVLRQFQSLLVDVRGVQLAWPTYEALEPHARIGWIPPADDVNGSA